MSRNVERSASVWFRTETEECIDQSADHLRFLAEAEMRQLYPTNISTWMTQMSMISRVSLAETLLS